MYQQSAQNSDGTCLASSKFLDDGDDDVDGGDDDDAGMMVKMKVVAGVLLLVTETVFIFWGCCHQAPHTGGLNNRNSLSYSLWKPQLKVSAKLGPFESRSKHRFRVSLLASRALLAICGGLWLVDPLP